MQDNRSSCCSSNNTAANGNSGLGLSNGTAYIDTYRILDSCRDKDCFEDVAVYLTDYGREVIEHSGNIRVCSANIVATNINVTPIQFNRGFYQVDARIFVKLTFEACVCVSNKQLIEGIAVCDKKAVLFGSEGNVSIFKSTPTADTFCTVPSFDNGCITSNLPVAVLEVADPIVLNTRIVERCHLECGCCCCSSCAEIPQSVTSCLTGALCDLGEKVLTVSLGFFSVTRIERPEQYLVAATEYSVPAKQCESFETDDPCSLFRQMEFPINEFSPPGLSNIPIDNGCGCRNKKS